MSYDADQFVEAMGIPTLKINGRTYRGRIISFEEWSEWEPRLLKLMKKELTVQQTRLLIYQLANAIYHKPFWKIWERSPGWQVLQLPLAAQMEALQDFAHSQGKANRNMASRTLGRRSRLADEEGNKSE